MTREEFQLKALELCTDFAVSNRGKMLITDKVALTNIYANISVIGDNPF